MHSTVPMNDNVLCISNLLRADKCIIQKGNYVMMWMCQLTWFW